MPQKRRIVTFIKDDEFQRFYWLKDKTVPWAVGRLGGVGFAGSDVCMEQDMAGLSAEAVCAVDGLRYAIAGLPETKSRFCTKMRQNFPPVIGTSYPMATRALFQGNVTIEYIAGATEALPYLLPEVDAICELVRTGESLRQNGLELFLDNITPVNLMLIRRDNSATI